MEVMILGIGKTNTGFIATGIEEYTQRLKRYITIKTLWLKDVNRKISEDQQKETEGCQILDNIQPSDLVSLLDEHGKEFTSREFSGWMQKQLASGRKRLIFVIGGPYGFSQSVYKRADGMISLSKMTFNHEMVRLFFVEQLYRAMTILRGEPYHHD